MARSATTLALLSSALTASAAPATAPTFAAWRAEHGKTYSSPAEAAAREAVYASTVAAVAAHNAAAGAHSFTRGINQFADLTAEEFRGAWTTPGLPAALLPAALRGSAALPPPSPSFGGHTLPDAVDWTAKGMVTPVKNAQCSALADELAGAVESGAAIKCGKLRAINEDQLVACSGCEACSCQLAPLTAYLLASGATFNYAAGNCSFTPDVRVSSFVNVPPQNATALQVAAAYSGPVVVLVEGDSAAFMTYAGGILGGTACGTDVNHVLLLTGYGEDGGKPYWRARNSWGEGWGEHGYIRLARDTSGATTPGACGLQTLPMFPVVHLTA
jgi:hypothetical protein